MSEKEKGGAARQKIMDAAAELFAEKGYTETTTLAIARLAGVNETTVFRNFGSKRELYAEIFCANTPGAEDILLSDLTNGAELKQDLTLMFREYIATCVRHIPNFRLSVQQVDELGDHPVFEESAGRFENMRMQMMSYLNMLKSFGVVADIERGALTEYLFSLFMMSAPRFTGMSPEESQRAQNEMADKCAAYCVRLLSVQGKAGARV